MRVNLILHPEELYDHVHELIRMAFPGCQIIREEAGSGDVDIHLERQTCPGKADFSGRVEGDGFQGSNQDVFTWDDGPGNDRRQLSRAARRFVYDLLVDVLGREINSYGTLTGMRPVKLVHIFLDQGFKLAAIQEKLEQDFRLGEDKARLLVEVAGHNRPFLEAADANPRAVSLYVGIPFCPSRCYYCSFPGAVLKNYEQEIKPFLVALHREMKEIAASLGELGLTVESIYLGGGTPTVLSEGDLANLLACLHQYYISPATKEITVEAGRPDTLTPGKLRLLQEMGINRVCINPQTMHESTLIRIGRNHTLKGVVEASEWARAAGIEHLNMDLIVGLPGEGLQENMHTAEQILKLKPDNITVHTLAVKRGSSLAIQEGLSRLGEKEKEVQSSVDFFASFLRQAGYQPYYLYRQKYMQASLENIGYAVPGSFSLYNIQVMEERQTLIGLGGGAGSKFLNRADASLTSFYNPKNPVSYCANLDRLISGKVDKLRGLH
ncbi:MAG TPA: coproporphyrinogen dehydrogenase HemZ [Syntrophomonadaceae bacterium]|nr:coproporphyrinogen dehydrogenase HemZ [Syntrophomonadaceae bacterium]